MVGDERRKEHMEQRGQNVDPDQISRAGVAIEAFGESLEYIGSRPRTPRE